MRTTSDALPNFYEGIGTDSEGRTLSEILAWPDSRLESAHDYIQWLFPLPERSNFNPDAPLLTPAFIAAFRASTRMQENLARALTRMLRFYGLEASEGGAIETSASFNSRAANWLTPSNHNHLRLTRMLRSLRVLGWEEQARSLAACLREIYLREREAGGSRISAETVRYWQDAVDGPL